MDGRMYGGQHGRMEEWMGGWMGGCMDGWQHGRTDGRTGKRMVGRMDEWQHGWVGGWMDAWTGGAASALRKARVRRRDRPTTSLPNNPLTHSISTHPTPLKPTPPDPTPHTHNSRLPFIPPNLHSHPPCPQIQINFKTNPKSISKQFPEMIKTNNFQTISGKVQNNCAKQLFRKTIGKFPL